MRQLYKYVASLVLGITASILSLSPSFAMSSCPQTALPPVIDPPASTVTATLIAPDTVLVALKSLPNQSFNAKAVQESTIFTGIKLQSLEPLFPDSLSTASARTTSGAPLSNVYRLHLTPGADVMQTVQLLSTEPDVLYAEPDYLAHSILIPNDPLYAEQWGLAQIDAPAAWDTTTGDQETVIAIIDAGLDVTHPDLTDRLWTNPGEIAANGIDDDANGYIDDLHGWNFVDDNADLSDNTGHGTQVTGVLAATGNNSTGIAGVCWGCRLMIVKVTQPSGVTNYSAIAAGIAYAAEKGADVINLSLGGYSDSATLRNAITEAAQTAVVVGGAGNDDQSTPFYPAAYPEVLAVAGTDASDVKAATSNYGTWVDVAAPGQAITTTLDGGTYGMASGTSVAASFASGVAGLLRSQHPTWSGDTVRAHIVQTTEAIDAMNPAHAGQLGSGRLNAHQALATAAQPSLTYQSHAVDGETNGRPEPGSTVSLDVTLYNAWADATTVQATLTTSDPYVSITTGSAAYGTVSAYQSGTSLTSFKLTLASSTPYAHAILCTLHVTAEGGYSVTLPFTLTTAPGTTYVHGTLTTQTWTSDRTYIIDNNTGIAAGHVLTIEPGTTVQFAGAYSLNVAGTLIADGTADAPIRFTRTISATENWRFIEFIDSSSDAVFDSTGDYTEGSILRHTIFEYGNDIYLEQASPYIAHNTLSAVGVGGVVTTTNAKITDNTLEESAINVDGNCTIMRNTISNGYLQVYGTGLISENSLNGTGLDVSGVFTISNNRIVDSVTGILVNGENVISSNLIANNTTGLYINGSPKVISNTLWHNSNTGIQISGGGPEIHNNNLIAGSGGYALRNITTNPISATENWWGTSTPSQIEALIYDASDEYGKGAVTYSEFLTGPEQTAPAYLTSVTLTPGSPVGIESVTFDFTFSRPMDTGLNPTITFQMVNPWIGTYDSTNSGLPEYASINALVADHNGDKWIATGDGLVRFDGTTWTIYNRSNSGLPANYVSDIAVDQNGDKWLTVAIDGGGLVHFDGQNQFTTYKNSYAGMLRIAIDQQGNKWVYIRGTTTFAMGRFDGQNWIIYNRDNSPLDCNLMYSTIQAIVIGHNNDKWVAQPEKVHHFNDQYWTVYTPTNSPLGTVGAITIDEMGNTWFAENEGGLNMLRPDGTWQEYPDIYGSDIAIDAENRKWISSGGEICLYVIEGETTQSIPCKASNSSFYYILIDADNTKWLLGHKEGKVSIELFHPAGEKIYPLVGEWIDAFHYRVNYDMNAAVYQGAYTLTVSSAVGADGIAIVPDDNFAFTVDYAGSITDRTPPDPPAVLAGGKEEDPTAVTAQWWATDVDSSITGYRYAIGSASGNTDIVSWTPISTSTLNRSGLGLVAGRPYWLLVQAKNEGGLWSDAGQSRFVAGQPLSKVYLPLVVRAR